ncbi:TRAP transporter small permease [Pararhodobacter oceanensis]|uniref:TRAP transporter small permease n=1 Tax=Pararhodobacter oceanensis TaxID=2172121 RepID=UPI003A8CF72D
MILARLHRYCVALGKPTAVIGILGLMLIAVITILAVVARAVFNHPLVWSHDAASLIIIIVVASCFPTGVLQRKHIAIEFLGAALGQRANRWLTAFGAAVTTIALAGLAWQLTGFAIQETQGHGSTIVMRIPTGPVWWLAAIVVWAAVPMQILVTLQAITGTLSRQTDGDHV